jgi:hypothetical protein
MFPAKTWLHSLKIFASSEPCFCWKQSGFTKFDMCAIDCAYSQLRGRISGLSPNAILFVAIAGKLVPAAILFCGHRCPQIRKETRFRPRRPHKHSATLCGEIAVFSKNWALSVPQKSPKMGKSAHRSGGMYVFEVQDFWLVLGLRGP